MQEIFIIAQTGDSQDLSQLVQTVAMLTGVLAFLLKLLIDELSKRREKRSNGSNGMSDRSMLSDLWRWHKPMQDPTSGQYRFPWYEKEDEEFKKELRETKPELAIIRQEIVNLREAVDQLYSHIKNVSIKKN